MRRFRVGLRNAPLAVALLAAGCFGGTQNPSYFPSLLPTGDIIRTHAKPPGRGYFSDFDPHACRLEVRPMEVCVPVRVQQVLIATVYDDKDQPRRKRRVEWIVEGPGNIVEVDESGYLAGRGYKVDNKYAVSYTDYFEHKIDRGNDIPGDDLVIRPGQSWCVLSSAVEGEATVTVYAPEINNWERGRQFVKVHFVDATWQFPQPAAARAGTTHTFSTKIARHTDGAPVSGYRVRYRLLDGPTASLIAGAAQIANSGAQEVVAVTDADGFARANIHEAEAKFGTSRLAVEVLRPDADGKGGFTVVGRSETRVSWDAPQVNVSIDAPKNAQLNQEVPVSFTIASSGTVEAQPIMLKVKVPAGMDVVSSSDKVKRDGEDALWQLPKLPGGQQHTVQAVFRPTRLGSFNFTAVVPTEDGQRVEQSASVQVTEAKLRIALTGPSTALAGESLPLQLTITNSGSGPATNVQLVAKFDDGLNSGQPGALEQRIPELKAGESKTLALPAIPDKPGRLSVRATAQGDGGVTAQAQPYQVDVREPKLNVQVLGPARSFLNQDVTWRILVKNPSDVSMSNVVLRAELPGEVEFRQASRDGKLTKDQIVVWNLGTAPGKQEVEVQVTGVCVRLADKAILSADVTADPLVERDGQSRTVAMARPFGADKPAEATLEILGVPALQLEVMESADPVEVGKRMTYTVRVRNTGSLAGNQVELTADVPKELRPLRASGPMAGRIDGQHVTFPAVDGVRPGTVALFTIEVEALSAGDARFAAELKAMSMGSPIRVEEPTRVLPRGTTVPVPKAAR